MINAVLVFNNNGQPRLTKFYSQIDVSLQQRLLSQIFSLVSNRPESACNFLPLPPLLAGASSSTSWNTSTVDEPTTLLYRHYATLYFIIISDSLESPLGLLDLIQVFVQALDQLFENVCELDLIFNFETLHATLEEMITGGCVVETDLARIVKAVRDSGKVAKRPKAGGKGGGGGGMGGGTSGLGRGGFMSGDLVWTGR
ncbi:clathrin adaptor complex small chain-domain-containing protein [Tuber borchii]|uniref:AP complex subunit sigma n=1 Tax=Tuber borchii TaxID=42251 RepID=A0A2T6ZMA1_TUBBO|nr:clathrin adaptor complex small chain-domain-containing protein [Tuber borchii]